MPQALPMGSGELRAVADAVDALNHLFGVDELELEEGFEVPLTHGVKSLLAGTLIGRLVWGRTEGDEDDDSPSWRFISR